MTEAPAPDPSALESILPEVHDVFSERQAERDLAIIKKVKKIDTDTRQIVTNREAEIKEVVRGEAGLGISTGGGLQRACPPRKFWPGLLA